jgi:preprotein translocase subunit SecE
MLQRFIAGLREFISDVKSEIKKVTFPTRAETLGSTSVVLILVVILSIFLSLIDHALVRLVKFVID